MCIYIENTLNLLNSDIRLQLKNYNRSFRSCVVFIVNYKVILQIQFNKSENFF